MTTTKTHLRLVVVASALCILFACKPKVPGSSDVKDLNVIMNGSDGVRQFECGPKAEEFAALRPSVAEQCPMKLELKVAKELEDTLRAALLPLPQGLCDYFNRSNGVVEVVHNAQNTCVEKVSAHLNREKTTIEAAIKDAGTDETKLRPHREALAWIEGEIKRAGETFRNLHSCWYKEEGGALTILLDDDPKRMAQEILPVFSYYLVETYTPQNLSLAFDKKLITQDQMNEQMPMADHLAYYRGLLAEKMLDDLENADKFDVIDAYTSYFGFTPDLRAPASAHFGNFVFAEATDALYCSEQSYAQFSNASGPFTNTYGAYRFMLADNSLNVLYEQPWHAKVRQ